ncbi:GNAT family N-acetyltransferase [Sellimonas intestinalis]|uniref:GNAT family N-acetyltransferase n=1 Tax=Sellimonas intestinalis TaxID=1653434 RepID=UPI0015EB4D13|nr:GNAT family N-acetyltransferase [Sellimonas intestinalis]MBA2212975.1 GNAT family N-acetyltransferase [Sellimonas intestinalis]
MIKLVVPSLEDMWFREQLINDEKTMEFNKKWGGTIHFPRDKWESWYDYWVRNPDGKRFYRYILDDNNMFVGEIAYHFDENRQIYIADIIVMAKYRGKGYGSLGLNLLCECAKQNGIEFMFDDIVIDNPAVSLFLKNGFYEEYRTDDYIMLKKTL